MGFQAVSAEELYRYALRIDDRTSCLTDRFSFSIILVNDSSPVCNEFLSKYFVDLCHRTADRIRFIYFPNLEQLEARTVGRHRSGPSILRTLTDLLSYLGRRSGQAGRLSVPPHRAQSDCQDDWQELRPPGLDPISSPEAIFASFDQERKEHAAVSSSKEAYRFAQRLGIGRFIPCLVMVTDIGTPEIHVLPFGRDLHVEELYHHVREWIDRFYECNRGIFDRWAQVEKRIIELHKVTDRSLSQLSKWHDGGKKTWFTLRSINDCLMAITGGAREDVAGWKKALDAVDVRNLPESEQRGFNDLRNRIDYLGSRASLAREMAEFRLWLDGANGFDALWDRFHEVSKRLHRSQGPAIMEALTSAIARMQGKRDRLRTPSEQLHQWWQEIGLAVSFKGYKRFRTKLSKGATISSEDIREEHSKLRQAIGRLSFMIEPQEGARQIIATLAGLLKIDSDSPEWRETTNELGETVTEFLSKLQRTIPAWLSEALPNASIESLLPQRDKHGSLLINDLLSEHSPLKQAIERREREDRARNEIIRREREQTADECRRVVGQKLDQILEQSRISLAMWEQHRGAVIAALQKMRDSAAQQLHESDEKFFRTAKPKISLDSQIISELRAALNEYARVVEQIHYPYRSDPLVRREPLAAPVADLLGYKREYHGIDPLAEFRRRLEETDRGHLSIAHASAGFLKEAELMQSFWTPGARIAKAISQALSLSRQEEVISPGLHGELPFRLKEALLRDGGAEMLGRLTDLELGEVLHSVLRQTGDNLQETLPRTRGALIELILARAGADPRPALFGQTAMRQMLTDLEAQTDDFSPEEVLNRGVDLRRKLEQFLKQFLALYGLLGLTEEERLSLPNQTLGTLGSLMVRVLKRPNPQTPACAEDDRWRVLADSIRAAHENKGWLDALVKALGQLPAEANCFAHHVLRDGIEMSTGERRRNLRMLIRDAATIVDGLSTQGLYPICLRFNNVKVDSLYVSRFEFDSDPPRPEKEVVAFSQFPPVIPGITGDLFKAIYRTILLMFPLSNPERIDPLLAPLVPV